MLLVVDLKVKKHNLVSHIFKCISIEASLKIHLLFKLLVGGLKIYDLIIEILLLRLLAIDALVELLFVEIILDLVNVHVVSGILNLVQLLHRFLDLLVVVIFSLFKFHNILRMNKINLVERFALIFLDTIVDVLDIQLF